MVRLKEDAVYSALKQNLERNAKGTLRWVEQRIEEDPSLDVPGRLELENGRIADIAADDLRVVYLPVSDDLIVLELVLDERVI